MAWTYHIGNETISEKDFEGKGHIVALPKLIQILIDTLQNFVMAKSATGLSVAPGVKLLTIDAGRAYGHGTPVRLSADSDPVNVYMLGHLVDSGDGQIPAYDPETGAARLVVSSVEGAGSFSAWTMWVQTALREQPEPSPFGLDVGGWGADMLANPEVGLDALKVPRIIPIEGISSAEPANPLDGQFWIVGPAPSGDASWTALGANTIAHRSAGAWVGIAPREGRDLAFDLGSTGGSYGSLYYHRIFGNFGAVLGGLAWYHVADQHPPARGKVFEFWGDAQLGPEHHGAQIFLKGGGHTLTLPDASATPGVLGMEVNLIRDDSAGDWTVLVAGGGTLQSAAPGGVAQIQMAAGESMSVKGNNPFTFGMFHWHILSRYQP